ncbi:XRE family transcriptional regulator [Mycobacteroides abscessus]|uniref:XRE family transcriptional regulator n=1 Tax=Mycobacteroides abscessus TaxID=36809 RepID=UPI0009A6957F|nr:XRE family transcriptional regulator [Mycobacteroides abscessus]
MSTHASVWDAITDTPDEAADLTTRAEHLHALQILIEQRQWTTDQAADQLGLTSDAVADLQAGRISQFSTGQLADALTAAR